MQKTIIQLPEIKLVGFKMRTNNTAEMNPDTAKIGNMIQEYFSKNLISTIESRKNPGTTYCVYTEYENDYTSDYTYFIGEEIESFNQLPTEFSSLIIPAQNYAKFTNGPGKMPEICINCWQEIWRMSDEELGGKRTYLADFEIYDKKVSDPNGAIMDIFIGIKPV